MASIACPSLSWRTRPTKLASAPTSLRPWASASSSRPTSKSASWIRTRGTSASGDGREEGELVGRDGDDIGILEMQQRRARLAPMHLDLGNGLGLVPFDDHDVARRELLQLVLQGGLRRAAKLVHQGPALRGAHEHLGAAGVAMAVGVLPGLVHVEFV